MMKRLHFGSRGSRYDKNKNNFCIVSGRGGEVLKSNIMVRKGAIVTYIWSFHENFENYRKLVLL